jgi:hypothetical protein
MSSQQYYIFFSFSITLRVASILGSNSMAAYWLKNFAGCWLCEEEAISVLCKILRRLPENEKKVISGDSREIVTAIFSRCSYVEEMRQRVNKEMGWAVSIQ